MNLTDYAQVSCSIVFIRTNPIVDKKKLINFSNYRFRTLLWQDIFDISERYNIFRVNSYLLRFRGISGEIFWGRSISSHKTWGTMNIWNSVAPLISVAHRGIIRGSPQYSGEYPNIPPIFHGMSIFRGILEFSNISRVPSLRCCSQAF